MNSSGPTVVWRVYKRLLKLLAKQMPGYHIRGQGRARKWARERLTTIGQACMSVLRQSLSDTISWAIEPIEVDHWNFERIKIQLALP